MDGVAGLPGSWDFGDAEIDRLVAGAPVDLGELVVGACEADLESFDFAEPAFAFGFADPGDQVAADFGDAGPLGGLGPEHRAPEAGLTELILVGRWREPWQADITLSN